MAHGALGHNPQMTSVQPGAASDGEAVAAIRAARRLRTLIADAAFAAGSRLPAERELAVLTGCSRATVRRALITLEAEGVVVQTSARVRRVAGAGASTGRGARRVVVLGGRVALGSLKGAIAGFISTAAATCIDRLQAGDCVPLPTVAGSRSWLDVLDAEGRIDAVVALSDIATQATLSGWLATPRPPLVVWAESLPSGWPKAAALNCVRHDHRAGAMALVKALAQRGCRRLAVIWWEPLRGHVPLWWEAERLAGYSDGARAAGIESPIIVHVPQPVGGPDQRLNADIRRRLMFGFLHDLLSGNQLTGDQLPGKHRCDGLLAIDDATLHAIGEALRMSGHVPGVDIQLAGYDHGHAYGAPALPFPAVTIDQDPMAIGLALAERVLALLAEPKQLPHHVLVPPTIIFK